MMIDYVTFNDFFRAYILPSAFFASSLAHETCDKALLVQITKSTNCRLHSFSHCDMTLGSQVIYLCSHLHTKKPSILSWKATMVGWRAGTRLGLVSL